MRCLPAIVFKPLNVYFFTWLLHAKSINTLLHLLLEDLIFVRLTPTDVYLRFEHYIIQVSTPLRLQWTKASQTWSQSGKSIFIVTVMQHKTKLIYLAKHFFLLPQFVMRSDILLCYHSWHSLPITRLIKAVTSISDPIYLFCSFEQRYVKFFFSIELFKASNPWCQKDVVAFLKHSVNYFRHILSITCPNMNMKDYPVQFNHRYSVYVRTLNDEDYIIHY